MAAVVHYRRPEPDERVDEGPPLSRVQEFSDDEEDMQDTTAEQLQQGKDLQGIPWSRLHITREQYRSNRLRSFVNYLNMEAAVKEGQDGITAEARRPNPNAQLFNFSRNWRSVHSTFVHFQLRNLLWATSKHDMYLVLHNKINHWSGLNRKTSTVMDFSGGSALGAMQVSTMCLKHHLLAAGGFSGELVLQSLSDQRGPVSERVTTNENGITNGIEIYKNRGGAVRVMASNNDCVLRSFDGETVKLSSKCSLPWAVNYSVVAPEGAGYGDCVAVVGDAPEAILLDASTGEVTHTLRGHLDYSFAAAWHPNGLVLATGNQDCTTRLWDVRNTSKSFATLRSRMGAVRSLRFSPDGAVLAVVEPADFVQLHDVAADYDSLQEIDVFGEIAGVSFSPEGERFFLAISDLTYSSLLQYNKVSGSKQQYQHWT